MKSTDKLFVAKLSEIGDKLENSDDLESVKKGTSKMNMKVATPVDVV